jgi:hypothetical protein
MGDRSAFRGFQLAGDIVRSSSFLNGHQGAGDADASAPEAPKPTRLRETRDSLKNGFSVTSSVYKEIAGEVTEKTFRYRLCSRYHSVDVESWMLQAQVWRNDDSVLWCASSTCRFQTGNISA